MASLPEYNCRVINGPTDLKKALISFVWMESDKQPKQQHQYNQTQININIVQFDMKITSLFFLMQFEIDARMCYNSVHLLI